MAAARAPGKSAAKKKSARRKPAEVDESVVAAVKRDLAEVAKRDAKFSRSGLAMTALALARELDEPKNSATSKSMCAKALTATLTELLALAPAEEANTPVDDLRARAKLRLAGGAAT